MLCNYAHLVISLHYFYKLVFIVLWGLWLVYHSTWHFDNVSFCDIR